jgi:type IV pilus assembly protein PilB
VIAQRLVRRICPDCATEYPLSEQEKSFFRGYFDYDPPDKLWRGTKCGRCNQTGYKGRQSIQEILMINHRMHELIMQGATTEELQQGAVAQGMRTLVKDGLRLILAGNTTVSEIVRSTFNTIIDTGATLDKNSIAYLSTLQRDQD